MDFATYSESAVKLVLWLGVFVFMLTFLILLHIILIHFLLIVKERRTKRFLATWRPLLMQSLITVPDNLPPVGRRDAFAFLSLWTHLHESLRGESKERLNRVARLVGVDKEAVRMLRKGGFRKRLMAIAVLGYLRENSVRGILWSLLKDDNPVISLSAARAMVLIDSKAAIPLIIPLINQRKDWAPVKVASILKEAGADVISRPLADAVLKAAAENSPYMIRYLELAHYDVAAEALHQILQTSQDDEVISACLRILKDPRDLKIVRKYLHHPRWHIRVQAAAVLGRIGGEEDKQELVNLLGDREWWVRYRAAQALASLPFVSLEDLKRIQAEHPDRFARDILTQVISERQKT